MAYNLRQCAAVYHNAISEYLRIDQIQCIIMIYAFDLHWHRFQGQKLLFSAKFAYCQQRACRSCSNIALTHTPLHRRRKGIFNSFYVNSLLPKRPHFLGILFQS